MTGAPLLVVDKLTKRFGGLIAIDELEVSVTENTRRSAFAPVCRETSMVMFPSRVNLQALLSRLSRTCRMRVRSVRMSPMLDGQSTRRRLPFDWESVKDAAYIELVRRLHFGGTVSCERLAHAARPRLA